MRKRLNLQIIILCTKKTTLVLFERGGRSRAVPGYAKAGPAWPAIPFQFPVAQAGLAASVVELLWIGLEMTITSFTFWIIHV
jgi:hypothetical protein